MEHVQIDSAAYAMFANSTYAIWRRDLETLRVPSSISWGDSLFRMHIIVTSHELTFKEIKSLHELPTASLRFPWGSIWSSSHQLQPPSQGIKMSNMQLLFWNLVVLWYRRISGIGSCGALPLCEYPVTLSCHQLGTDRVALTQDDLTIPETMIEHTSEWLGENHWHKNRLINYGPLQWLHLNCPRKRRLRAQRRSSCQPSNQNDILQGHSFRQRKSLSTNVKRWDDKTRRGAWNLGQS